MNEIKQLQALVDITNYLAEHEFTYDEASEFAESLTNEINASRMCNEYETVSDYYNRKPCCDIANKVIVPLSKVNAKEICDEMFYEIIESFAKENRQL